MLALKPCHQKGHTTLYIGHEGTKERTISKTTKRYKRRKKKLPIKNTPYTRSKEGPEVQSENPTGYTPDKSGVAA